MAARRQTAAFIGRDCWGNYGGALPRRRYASLFIHPVHPVSVFSLEGFPFLSLTPDLPSIIVGQNQQDMSVT